MESAQFVRLCIRWDFFVLCIAFDNVKRDRRFGLFSKSVLSVGDRPVYRGDSADWHWCPRRICRSHCFGRKVTQVILHPQDF